MSINLKKDVIIIGGGLAGSHLALSLQTQGISVGLLHSNSSQGHCASLTPAALFNPAAALQAKKSAFAEESYALIQNLISSFSAYEKSIIQENGILRPATDDRLYDNFKRSANNSDWPAEWIEWLEEDHFSSRFPELDHALGGLLVHVGLTVNTPLLIDLLHNRFLNLGGQITEGLVVSVAKKNNKWVVTLDNEADYETEKVVFANGFGIKKFDEWSFLKLHPVKGETLTLNDTSVQFPHSIASRGYLAFLDNQLVIGSTYNHHFDDIKPDNDSINYLLSKLKVHFPEEDVNNLSMNLWSGVRLTTPDRLPVVGEHPSFENMYILAGFGSKGLMYSQMTATDLADFILHKTPVRQAFSIHRFL